MEMTDRIKLVDDMVKEGKDRTIRDYLEAVAEIDRVGLAMKELYNIKIGKKEKRAA